jgi:trk system potassium uptake protein TrkH
MHFRAIAKNLGLLFMLLGASMVFSLPWAWGDFANEQKAFFAIFGAMAVCLAAGGALYFASRNTKQEILRKEGIAIVGLGWVGCGILGALPFVFSGLLGPVDAIFESFSGFSTTGATVLTSIEDQPRVLLFWRSFTHWLGGMGILVLFVAVLPYLGVGGKAMFKTEAPGLNVEGIKPRIRETAITLWRIYIVLSIAQTVLLLVKMDLFESLCHTFGTMATGGFSTRDKSIEAFNSAYVESVIVVFMIFAGTNFSLFFLLFRRQIRAAARDTELRVYLGTVAIAVAVITFQLVRHGGYEGTVRAGRDAVFQVVAIMTTTGYGTADFDLWPHSCRMLLVALMFVGGMAGSTGGGMKVIRVMVLAKSAIHNIRHVFSPRTVRALRISGRVLPESIRLQVLAFFCIWMGITAVSTLAMTAILQEPMQARFENPDVLATSFTCVAATLNNIGPGLAQVGESQNYAFIPAHGKLLLSLLMVLGRLELYAILVLFVPRFWKN